VAGAHLTRAAYIYLYGGDPYLISFDLEDEAINSNEWDCTVRRGEVRSLEELRDIVLGWLAGVGA
jgi:hypothetical protein